MKEDLASTVEVVDDVSLPGATIPSHIIDFLNNSIEEFKRLTLSKALLKNATEKEEGIFPNCLLSQTSEVDYWWWTSKHLFSRQNARVIVDVFVVVWSFGTPWPLCFFVLAWLPKSFFTSFCINLAIDWFGGKCLTSSIAWSRFSFLAKKASFILLLRKLVNLKVSMVCKRSLLVSFFHSSSAFYHTSVRVE